jgi:hypothetical protein
MFCLPSSLYDMYMSMMGIILVYLRCDGLIVLKDTGVRVSVMEPQRLQPNTELPQVGHTLSCHRYSFSSSWSWS